MAYFSKLKFLRLKSLSDAKLDPEKQKNGWRGITVEMFNSMVNAGLVTQESLATYNSDELVFYDEDRKLRDAVAEFAKSEYGEWNVKVEEFDLRMIKTEKDPFFVKKYADGSLVMKCVHFSRLPACVRMLEENKELL